MMIDKIRRGLPNFVPGLWRRGEKACSCPAIRPGCTDMDAWDAPSLGFDNPASSTQLEADRHPSFGNNRHGSTQ